MFVCSALSSTANPAEKKELEKKRHKPKLNNHKAAVKVFAQSVSCNTVRMGLITVF